MEGSLSWELPLPEHFQAVAGLVTEEQVADPSRADPTRAPPRGHSRLRPGGYDHICVHQVGKDQKGFFEFYAEESFPSSVRWRRPGASSRRAKFTNASVPSQKFADARSRRPRRDGGVTGVPFVPRETTGARRDGRSLILRGPYTIEANGTSGNPVTPPSPSRVGGSRGLRISETGR